MNRIIKENKNTNEIKKGNKFIKGTMISSIVIGIMQFIPAVYAATSDPLQVINNLSDFMFGLIRAIGIILLGWGVVQVGLALKTHDPSQRANGFMTLAGGVIITFAKEILNLILG